MERIWGMGMLVVAVTDVHGDSKAAEELAERIVKMEREPDAIFIAGDITNFGSARVAEKVLRPLLELGIPIVAVHGNCDGRDVPEYLEELGISAHDRRVEVRGIGVVGIGGSNITPFHTIWELSEEEIEAILRRNYRAGDVILSHVPPYGTKVDLTRSGIHVGSKALRKFIWENKPPLVITGHIHEARGVDKVNGSLVVNPGPLFRGYYALVEIEETRVSLMRL